MNSYYDEQDNWSNEEDPDVLWLYMAVLLIGCENRARHVRELTVAALEVGDAATRLARSLIESTQWWHPA
jgi:hypothetical protein